MMKHTYSLTTSWLRWLCLCLLLALPGLGMAQSVTLTSNAADPQDFGSVPVGTTSASKAYTVSGSGLVDDITVAIPSRFEGSTDNVGFSTTAITLSPAGGTVPNTVIYLRFKPTATGPINRFFTASTFNASGTAITSSPSISLSGTGTVGTPTITVNPNALTGFGNQAINTASAPKTVAVTGTSLTADILVQAPTGFLVSSDGTAYATTATLTQTGGTVNTTLYVEFKPTAAGPTNGDVTLTSTKAANQTVSVSGTGVAPTPVLNVSPATLPDFGSVAVGATGATTGAFTVSGSNLSGNVTITPPAGFRIRTGTNAFSTSPIVLTPAGGTLASTSIDVRFSPPTPGTYSSAVSVSTPNGGAAVTQAVAVSGTGTPSSGTPSVNVTPGALDFGAVTSSGSTSTLSFDVSGTDLTANLVLTPNATNIQFRNASAGGAFSNNSLTLVPTSGTVSTQTIEVKLVPTIPIGNYSKRIDVTSGSAATMVSLTAANNSGNVSDISVSTFGTDFTFATKPSTISASKSYKVAATNLLQPLVVAPAGTSAGYFEVSKDNSNFFSSVSFAPDAQGNVVQQTVYVHFVPGNSTVTVTANIRNSSSPAPATDVSVTGISESLVRLSRTIGSFPDLVKGTQSAPVAVRLDGFLLGGDVDIRFPITPDGNASQMEFSIDNGVSYTKSSTFSPNAEGNFSQNLLVRFAPVHVGFANEKMEYHNTGLTGASYIALPNGNGAATGFAVAVEPTAQSTAYVARSADGTSATIIFNLNNPPTGTSYGTSRLVIATPSYNPTLPTRLFPKDRFNSDPGQTANGSYIFGTGTPLEKSSADTTKSTTNTYVVFSGQSTSFTVTNLDPALYYQFYSFEFNNDNVAGAENYRVPSNQPQVPLPVELLAFTAQRHGKQVDLNWATASEKNSRSFDVERSADGQQFTAILSKAGQGTSSTRTNYTAADRQPLPGLSYYRLKQIDLDGTFAYSPVVSVQSDGAVEIGIYPNPTAGKLTISLPGALAASAPRVRISDLMGRVVKELSLPATGEVDLSALPAGTYLVNVGGQQVRSRIVKY